MISLTTMMIKHDMFESIEDDDDKNPLRIMFTKAMLSAPSVIVIKDLDILAVDGKKYLNEMNQIIPFQNFAIILN